MLRRQPNIIVTGTPGVGKTSHCEQLASNTGLKHLSINSIVKDRSCHEGWSEEHKSWIVDEEKVRHSPSNTPCTIAHQKCQLLDSLEDEVPTGGYIIDWHACDLFPESWIDLVVVLRTEPTKLYDRLRARKYPEKKLQENLDSEIMEVLLEEARDAYDEEIVIELRSDETDDIEGNVARIEKWLANWKQAQAEGVTQGKQSPG
ncbi:adenylate kinase, partial [Lecanoromycetidae sp. Uapishka_2]